MLYTKYNIKNMKISMNIRAGSKVGTGFKMGISDKQIGINLAIIFATILISKFISLYFESKRD